jgi:hypothetical protein
VIEKLRKSIVVYLLLLFVGALTLWTIACLLLSVVDSMIAADVIYELIKF